MEGSRRLGAMMAVLALGGLSAPAQAANWKDTNGAANGVVTETGTVPGLALIPRTLPVAHEFEAKCSHFPAYDGFTTYDEAWALAQAMERAHSTKPDAIVAEMEKTAMVGTLGRYGFYGPKDKYTHALRYGKHWVRGIFMQWQDGKQVCVWPADECPTKLMFPASLKLAHLGAK